MSDKLTVGSVVFAVPSPGVAAMTVLAEACGWKVKVLKRKPAWADKKKQRKKYGKDFLRNERAQRNGKKT